jgi:hypothetical protein
LNSTFIAELITSTSVQTSYVTGGSQGTSVAVSITAGRTSKIGTGFVGTVVNTSNYLTGNIHEVLGFSRALSTDDRQTVEGYLAWKWGLQGNLPSTHPYKFLSPASNYSAAVVPQGLLVRFDATTYSGSGAWSNTAALGSGYNATVEAGTPSKNGAGNGVVFNGATNFTFSNIALGNSWSASMWIKRTGTPDEAAAYITQNYTGVINMRIYTNYDDISPDQLSGGFFGPVVNGSKINMTLNSWVYVTYTWSGTTMSTYLNGTNIGSSNVSATSVDQGSAYRIGRRWDLASYVRAEIGQILIYNRAITAAEVAQNYAATSNVYTV